MTVVPDPLLASWQTYFFLVGSSGAALIGVQFVVITLIVTLRRRTTGALISAFGTPTVVHLSGALIVSALMSAPWHSLVPVSVAVATCGLAGLGYGVIVIRRARRQTGYKPVWEDWLWYATLPCGAYAALATGALFLCTSTRLALFAIGASALALLFVGIHNAWDAVTHIVVTHPGSDEVEIENAADGRAHPPRKETP